MSDIRQLRERLHWSQKTMAEYLGCDQATVSRIERGQPPSGPVARLLRGLQDDVRTGRTKPAPQTGEAA